MLGAFGANSYLSVLARQLEEEERRRKMAEQMKKMETSSKGGDVHTGSSNYGFLMPRQYQGEAIDPDVSRQARSQALIAFGLPLLSAGSTGDWGGALAKGVAGFTGTMNETLERYRQQREHEEDQQYTRNRQEEEDARQAARDKAYMDNLEADNAARDEAAKVKAERDANRLKYHQQLLNDVKDPEKRKLLEPFLGTDQFDDKWFQLNKPEDEDEKVRLNLALASSSRAADAAARAIDNMEYNRERDRASDLRREQDSWDSEVAREAKTIADALKADRNAGVGRPDMNNPAAGLKTAPNAQELLNIEEQAKALARQKVTATRGPRPGATVPSPVQPVSSAMSPTTTYHYDANGNRIP